MKIFLTGGTDGIGLSALKTLLTSGHQLYVTYRNSKKLEKIKSSLRVFYENKKLAFFECDLAEPEDIDKTISAVKKLNIKFDCLINNAGAILLKKSFNSMGIEKVFATNHLGPFYLTNSFLKENFINPGGRIINVGSSAHQSAVLDFNNLDSSNSRSWYERYSRSKLCNLLFTLELSKKTSNKNIQVNCVHPGIVNTNIAQEHKGILQLIIKLVLNFKGISPAEGADTLVYLATNDTARNVSGKYFIKRKQAKPSKEALKHDVSVRLWQESIKILDRFFS